MASLPTEEQLHGHLVVNGGYWTAAFIKMMDVGSASSIIDMLQKSVDKLFRRSWKNRLPSDYRDILSRAVPPLECKSEEELKVILYKGILIDQGGKWFSMDKETGKKSYVISARKLAIAWSNDTRYYRWISLPESERCKFPEVAQLLQVCWLDIAGSIDSRDLSPRTNYGAYLILKFVNDDNYGLDVQPAQISVKVGGTVKSGTAYLRPNEKKQLMKKRLQFLYRMQVLLTNPSKSLQQQEIENEEDEENEDMVVLLTNPSKSLQQQEIEDEEDEDMVDEEDEDRVDEEDQDEEDEDKVDEEDEEIEDDQEIADEENEEDEAYKIDEEIQVEEPFDSFSYGPFSFESKETEDEFATDDNGGGSPKGAANDRADDDWLEIELGTFFVDGDDGMVEMSLKETGGHWKSGFIIQGIEVRPVDLNLPK